MGFLDDDDSSSMIVNNYYTLSPPKDQDGNYDIESKRLTNVAEPVNDTDVLRKADLDHYYQFQDKMVVEANQSEVNVGAISDKYVSPLCMKNWDRIAAIEADIAANAAAITENAAGITQNSDDLQGIYPQYAGHETRITALESNTENLDSRASSLETRTTALESAPTPTSLNTGLIEYSGNTVNFQGNDSFGVLNLNTNNPDGIVELGFNHEDDHLRVRDDDFQLSARSKLSLHTFGSTAGLAYHVDRVVKFSVNSAGGVSTGDIAMKWRKVPWSSVTWYDTNDRIGHVYITDIPVDKVVHVSVQMMYPTGDIWLDGRVYGSNHVFTRHWQGYGSGGTEIKFVLNTGDAIGAIVCNVPKASRQGRIYVMYEA